MRVLRCIAIMSVLVVLLPGCAATGSNFTVAEAPPTDMAVVYFYRPKMHVGSALSLAIVDNGNEIVRIQNGQFIKHIAAPGKHKFHTDTMAIDKPIELDLEKGETYYVRTGLRMGMWTGTWYLSRVYDEEALGELSNCCKSGGS